MVTAIGSTPKEAADIANAMGDAFINSYNRIMNYSSDKVFQYYQSQRDSMTREISKAEDEFSAFRAKEGIVSYEQELGLKLEKLSQIELGLEESYMTQKENQTKIADLKERLASMPDQVKVTETYRKQEAALKRDLQLKLDELRQKYTEENPKVIEIREQLNTIEKGQKERGTRGVVDEETYGENFIKRTFQISLSTLENDQLALKDKILEYQKTIQKYRMNLDQMTEKQKGYFDVQQKVSLKRELLKTIETRMQEAKMARDANVGDLQVVEYSEIPKTPEPSRRKLMTLAVFMAVLLLGLLVTAGMVILNPAIKTCADIKSIQGLKCLGLLPDSTKVSEQEYMLKVQSVIYKLDLESNLIPRPVITFSGLDGGEGKSTFIQKYIELKLKAQKKILLIESVNAAAKVAQTSAMNDFLFSRNENPMPPAPVAIQPGLDKLYLRLTDDFYNHYLTPERWKLLLKTCQDYDCVLVELFNIPANMQIYYTVIASADENVLFAKYMQTSRSALTRTIEEMRQKREIELWGLITFYDIDYL
jgi:capsular polysaccharide biosynthesis protein